jgi:hypothetical protein
LWFAGAKVIKDYRLEVKESSFFSFQAVFSPFNNGKTRKYAEKRGKMTG